MNDQNLICNLFVKIQQGESGGDTDVIERTRLYHAFLCRSAPAGEPIIAPCQRALTNSVSIVPAQDKSTVYSNGSLTLVRRVRRGFPDVFGSPAAFPLLACFDVMQIKFGLAYIKA
jgi:hypothetical protein